MHWVQTGCNRLFTGVEMMDGYIRKAVSIVVRWTSEWTDRWIDQRPIDKSTICHLEINDKERIISCLKLPLRKFVTRN